MTARDSPSLTRGRANLYGVSDWIETARSMIERGATNEEIVWRLKKSEGATLREARDALDQARGVVPQVPGLDRVGLDRAIAKYAYIETDAPLRALGQLIEECERADQAELVWLAILVIEPLLDEHVDEVGDAFAAALEASSKLREAYDGADLSIAPEIERRLETIVEAHRESDA
jgi:hypothetical protein